MFDELEKQSFPEREDDILHAWKQEGTFLASLKQREGANHFVFYDGPPFATGLPHYGHLLAGTIKDVVPRYRTMRGDYVPRRFGWDCHGLPVESQIEKAHQLSGADSIEQFGIAEFNEACRSIVLKYTREWQSTVERMGRWVDFSKTWKTMDMPYMESVWWVFRQLFDKGLIYKGYKVMPFSAKLGTPLSNFEAGENYQDVDDPSLTVRLPLLGEDNTSLVIWTTTPWTLPSNLAAAVGPDIEYAKIKDKDGQYYILAKERVPAYYKNDEDYEIVETYKGSELVGREYEPPLPYFSDRRSNGAFRVLPGDFVSTEDGTGIVHCAPAFGEADFMICQQAGIELVCPVDTNGHFTDEIPDFAGRFVKEADRDIIKRLKADGKLVHQTTIRHRYPMCPRTDTPLIYRAIGSWFVNVETIKQKLLDANDLIHWVPGHIKHGRFGKWLEGARDWAISRNRYWGTPIPLWQSEDGDVVCIGSVAELEELTGSKIEDLHRHHIDQLSFEKDGKTFTRIPEVFDCWFESGSMPYAQNHYPFENPEAFERQFPADFIAEGLDQTRGWFYTLTILAAALFDKPAFRNVVVNGIILASDGNKMSKRLRNYPDPMEMVEQYGADAIRLYMLHSPAVRGEDLRFSEKGVELVLRQVLIPWWNAYSFFITYARIYKWTPQSEPQAPEALLDRWILSKLQGLVEVVTHGMDGYDLNAAVEPFVGFIDQLTNWYIRRSRRRFWAEEDSPDRQQAFQTLYTVLLELSKIAAPFVPFISDSMYRNLASEGLAASVHLCDFPQVNTDLRDKQLEEGMSAVQTVVSLGHSLRKEHKVKVRQPLPEVRVSMASKNTLQFLADQQHLVADELNVKEVGLTNDETEFVSLTAKPNFPVLGRKVGRKMPLVQELIQGFDQGTLGCILDGGSVDLTLEDELLTLTSEDVLVERTVHEGHAAATEGGIVVALNLELSEDLLLEGLARELVNKINTMRRDQDFDVQDRIAVTIQTTARVKEAFEKHSDYITQEVLAVEWNFADCQGTNWDLNGEAASIEVSRRSQKGAVS